MDLRRWTCEPYSVADAIGLADALSLSPAAASILVRRGIREPAAARAFLAADERADPGRLPGVPEACPVVLDHVGRHSRMAVFGDYDVDGVCSTAIAVNALRALGADPLWQLPSRDEGYGLSEEAVRRLAGLGVRLLVTVDCGVTAVAEVALARSLGMEVVVTDHHRPGEELPDCPIVHPGLGEGPSSELCAAGVALKLSEAVRAAAGLDPRGADEDLDLAGLATLCDMVPLVGENRRIAREGLAALARTSRPGLRALMRVAALESGEVDSRAAGFRLGPRINAAGRLGRADAALELVLTEDEERAEEVARELDMLNHDRRETEQRILHEADAACASQMSAAALVVAGEGWHPGVVGIVASRLVERHRRPAVVIALEDGSGRGSGRSIAPYDLHAGLAAASRHLSGFGGHPMAAGLQIEAGSLPAFRQALAAHAGAALAPTDLVPPQRVDAVVPGGALGLELAEELERLGPFGAGNPEPVLLVPGARVEHVTAMGEQRTHARFSLATGGARARGVAFRTSQRALAATGAEPHDAAVTVERNRWNGAVEARVVLRSLSPTRPGRLHDVCGAGFWAAFDRELDADPARWWKAPPPGSRRTVDRRGHGFAGVAGDLLSSGETVALVVADVERRRASLEALVAGLAPGERGGVGHFTHHIHVSSDQPPLPAVAWEALGGEPELSRAFTHLVALDPPPVEEGLALLRCGAGFAHLAWGPAERDFALTQWRSQLSLREPLAALWRALREARSLHGDALGAALRGPGPYPRSGALCARLVRVLSELGLAEHSARERSLHALEGPRTDLDRSAAHRAYSARLAAVERHLGSAGAPPAVARPA